MQRENVIPRPADGQDYAALRQSGTSPARARIQLNLDESRGRRLEKLFRTRTARGSGDNQLPKFARHDAHVAAVLGAGGFWAFSERRLGRHGVAVCLPMIAPPKG